MKTRVIFMIFFTLNCKFSFTQNCQCSKINPCDVDFIKYKKRGEYFSGKGDYQKAKESFLIAKKISFKNCIKVLLENNELSLQKVIKRKSISKASAFNIEVNQKESRPVYILPKFKKIVDKIDTFYLAENEVTRREWGLFCRERDIPFLTSDPDLPITSITWNEANEYCDWLSSKTGNLFRLPSEDEWTFALGKIPSSRLEEFLWAYTPNKEAVLTLHSVKSKKPNSFGLYDMLGNASEWIMDWYKENNITNITNDDEIGDYKLVIGCSYEDEIFLCKEILKKSFEPTYTKKDVGFRICTSKN